MSPTGSAGLGGTIGWFWGGLFIVLLLLLLFVLFAGIRGAGQWAEKRLTQSEQVAPVLAEVIHVVLKGGDRIAIDADAIQAIETETRAWLAGRRQQARLALKRSVGLGMQEIADLATARVPSFTNWHYSLKGEYMRLFHAAWGDLPGFIAAQLESQVFKPAGTGSAIEQVVLQLERELTEGLGGAAADLGSLVTRLMREYTHVTDARVPVRVVGEWRLDLEASDSFGPYLELSDSDLGRQALASTFGMAAGALAAKKLAAATVAKVSASIAGKGVSGTAALGLAKFGAKSAAKSAGSAFAGGGVGAASGATLCSATLVGIPLAPGCALLGGAVTGIGTWLLVDKAVLEADAYLNREEFEAGLEQSIREQIAVLGVELEGQFGHLIDTGYEKLGNDLLSMKANLRPVPGRDFAPAEAALTPHRSRVEPFTTNDQGEQTVE